jgi:solute carrier family 25 protein 34/35
VHAAALGNPLFLVKAQIQAYSPALPVGAQHAYRSPWHGLSSIWSTQGVRGLTNGMSAAVIRTAMGSSIQVPSYIWTKSEIVRRGIGSPDSAWTFLASSAVSGVCSVCVFSFTVRP